MLELSRDIPAFILSTAVIGSIWLAHSNWSRTFGLQDRLTIYLSLALVMLVLIFVYPIKLMCQATILYLSDGQLGTPLGPMEWGEVADLIVYFALGLLALSLIIVSLHLNAMRHGDELALSEHEVYFCKRTILAWLVVLTTALTSIVIVALTEEQITAWAGLVYFSLALTIPAALHAYSRYQPRSRAAG